MYFSNLTLYITKNILKTLETVLKIQIILILFNFFYTYVSILYGIFILELMYNIMIIIKINDILTLV